MEIKVTKDEYEFLVRISDIVELPIEVVMESLIRKSLNELGKELLDYMNKEMVNYMKEVTDMREVVKKVDNVKDDKKNSKKAN